MNTLIDILSMRREHDSMGEDNFISTYIHPLKPEVKCDDEGNVLAYVVDNSKGKSTILWSSHIDTMHRNKTKDPDQLMQEVWVDEEGIAFVSDKDDCLGADDGAGIWLMLEMIKADCAGTYIFHRGEEKGCWGSSRMAVHHATWLSNFTHAIAFDRRGNTSIITHQTGARGCSDALGNRFIELLNMGHELDPTGVYTDTAEYMELIPECVNVSAGYQGEHSSRETLDTNYILALRDAMCTVDWLTAELPVDRDPTVYEGRYGGYDGYNSYTNWPTYNKDDVFALDEHDIPQVKDLIGATTADIRKWVRATKTENLVWLIEDLVSEIAELNYQLEEASDLQYMADDDGDESEMYLKVGL